MSDKPSSNPFPFLTSAYSGLKQYFDSEDVVAAISLPILSSLMGGSMHWKEGVKGFVNQILYKNIVMMEGASLNLVTQHSVKALLAGALLPVENMLMKKGHGESFYRAMSKGTVASLIAGAIGPAVGDALPAYT